MSSATNFARELQGLIQVIHHIFVLDERETLKIRIRSLFCGVWSGSVQLYTACSGCLSQSLTLKVRSKFAADIFKYFFLFFIENKTSHFI